MTATLTVPHEAGHAAAPERQPRWVRPALLVLLAGTAVLYLWDLGASGYANDFYAAAVQAGTKSWKAMFFGAFDAAGFITVDKPPAALWVMSLSGRLFGFNSWSMLVPQALEGVAAVGLLFAAVRRVAGPAAGLLAGTVFALTPVATLMFRFNNPDALLTLLLVAAGYAVVRATERAGVHWLMLAGALVGFGFLTKMLQAFLVIPAFGLVYLIAAPTGLWRRLSHLLAAVGAVVVSAGWWVAAVELWPASSRPYIGGSTDNSILQLTFGYNGLGRIFGNGQPGGGGGGPAGGGGGFRGGGPGGGGFGGATGLTRMFGESFGTQISWLIPAALVALVLGLWLTRRRPRTDLTRAALVLWGGWLLVTGLVFSYMQGIVHPYYTVVLAPPIAALVAITGRELWHHRQAIVGRVGLAAMVGATAVWSYVLLERTASWHPELRYGVLTLGALAVVGLVVGLRATMLATGITALVAGLGATAAYAADTAGTAHAGSIPSAGPAGGGMGGPGGGFGAPGARRYFIGGFPGRNGAAGPNANGAAGLNANGAAGPSGVGGPNGAARGGGQADSQLVALLKQTTSTWAAATNGSQSAAPLQLASGRPVMSIGGFGGGDPAPTLAQFQAYVAAGKVRYYIGGGFGGGFGGGAGGGAGGGPGDRAGNGISTWVAAHYTATTVGGTTVYDLSAPTS